MSRHRPTKRDVLVRWLRGGIMFVNGISYERNRDDEDMMPHKDALKRAARGEIEIVSACAPIVTGIPGDAVNPLQTGDPENVPYDFGDGKGISADSA